MLQSLCSAKNVTSFKKYQRENSLIFFQVQKIRVSLAAVVASESIAVPDATVVPEEGVVVEKADKAVQVPWQHQDEDSLASSERLREIEKSLELIGQEVRQGQQQDVVESEEATDNSFQVSSRIESEFAAAVDSLMNNEFIEMDDGYVSGHLLFFKSSEI